MQSLHRDYHLHLSIYISGIFNSCRCLPETKLHSSLLMRMQTGKAAGSGDIPIELIKSSGQKLLEIITILLNKIINGEKVPEE